MSIVTPSSSCQNCKVKISWYHNIPLLSYMFLKGKCSNCNNKISLIYPFVELLTAIITLVLFIKFGLNFEFFSNNIKISLDKKSNYVLSKYDKKSISAYWNIMSKNDYKTTLKQFNEYVKFMNLNDWAKYLLIYETGYELYKNKSMANLFSWFYLTKMSYDTKIAYNDNNLYLLFSKEVLTTVS